MALQTRPYLINEFRAGERPSGDDFRDLVESCLNKTTDGVNVDVEGNLVLLRGVQLGPSNATVNGGLRFAAGQVQACIGGTWLALSTGSGPVSPFQQLTPTTVALPTPQTGVSAGLVGIGPFSAAAGGTLPTYRFEVPLDVNPAAGTGQQVRLGNIVCCNGQGASGLQFAQIAHFGFANDTSFALRQSSNGTTTINAATGRVISFRQNNSSVRMGISTAGNVVIGGESDLAGAPAGSVLQVNGALFVAGTAFKNNGVSAWDNPSDARCKENVRELEAGLEELRKVRPVRYRYNGRAGTPAGLEGVGVLAQEIETVLPETVHRVRAMPDDEPALDDLRVFNAHALTFVLINAVKELAGKVDGLERALAAIRGDDGQGASV
jgi:Chaperone of endosialidase